MSSMSLIPATYYSVPPANSRYVQHGHKPLGVMARLAQGAGSALLMFAGADTMTSGASAAALGTPPLVDFTSIEGIAQSVLTGGLTGPMQIVAAVFLFLVAGKCIARFVGLAAVATILVLHMQGVTVDDALVFVDGFSQRFAAAVLAFQNAQIS
ncbi:MAG: hypothetical protein WD076_02050 [Parvularculaceae bacterium]